MEEETKQNRNSCCCSQGDHGRILSCIILTAAVNGISLLLLLLVDPTAMV